VSRGRLNSTHSLTVLNIWCTCFWQVKLLVNEGSDAGSDEDDNDTGNDNDASSAASKNDSDDNLSSPEDKDSSKKQQSATDRLSESHSSNSMTVTPIKIKCRPKRIRTMDRILHLKHSRRRGRPPLTQNVSFEHRSFEPSSRTLSPAVSAAVAKIRRVRGRPKGSKNKVKKWPWLGAKQWDSNKQNSLQLTTDTLARGNYSSAERLQTTMEDSGRNESLEEEQSRRKSSKQTFWRPPTDADSRRVLDQISITDITANALTVTIRESATQDGFFQS